MAAEVEKVEPEEEAQGLIGPAKRGGEAAARLLQLRSGVIKRTVRSRVNQSEVEDAFALAMNNAYNSMPTLNGTTLNEFDSWLRVIAGRAAYRVREGRKKQEGIKERVQQYEPPVDGAFENHAVDRLVMLDAIRQLIKKEKPELAEVALLYYYHRLSYEEIAEWQGVQLGTVRSRLSRSKEALKKILGGGHV